MRMIKMIDSDSSNVNLNIGVTTAATTAIALQNVAMSSALIVKMTIISVKAMTITTSVMPRMARKIRTTKVKEPKPSRLFQRLLSNTVTENTPSIYNTKFRTTFGSDERKRTVRPKNPKSAPTKRISIELKNRLCATRLCIILTTVVAKKTPLFGARKYLSRQGNTQTL